MMTEVIYTGNYFIGSRTELLERVSNQLSASRFAHICRVEKKALELAQRFNYSDLERVSITALTHDYAKERPDSEMIHYIETRGFDLSLISYGNQIWHGLVGAEIVRDELGIIDSSILQAIRVHTTGSEEMSTLDKIIYVADYVEDGRDFPVVNQARELAKQSLDLAVAFETQQTLLYLIENNHKIYPKTIDTYNRWVAK